MAPCGTHLDIIFHHILGCLDLRQACCRCHHSSCYTSICRSKEVGKTSRWNLATNLVQCGRGMVYISSKTHSRWMMVGCLGWRFFVKSSGGVSCRLHVLVESETIRREQIKVVRRYQQHPFKVIGTSFSWTTQPVFCYSCYARWIISSRS